MSDGSKIVSLNERCPSARRGPCPRLLHLSHRAGVASSVESCAITLPATLNLPCRGSRNRTGGGNKESRGVAHRRKNSADWHVSRRCSVPRRASSGEPPIAGPAHPRNRRRRARGRSRRGRWLPAGDREVSTVRRSPSHPLVRALRLPSTLGSLEEGTSHEKSSSC
jgi:hypothetical protein